MRTLTLAGAVACLATGALAQEVVRLATEGAYPPYNFINDQGEVDGFERELGDALCARAGLTCEWVVNQWDSILPNLLGGNYDVIIAGMNITNERDALIDFTQPYMPPAPAGYAALSGDADIAGGTVSAQAGTVHAGHVADTGATLLEFATPEETVQAVRDGEADAVFATHDFLLPIVAASDGEMTIVGEPVIIGRGVGMGLRESDAELRDRFDTAIAAMKEDGSLNGLLAKWFPDNSPQF
ncbi:transporter substrate-binding domain-containing protein [Rubellimicrobium roseum]|uniref:Transporter substrate-binding domain-containing protein n=1 Tax=Rubellimicrobium roseum TaxID=687525 RepID=A0A5C4NEG8_9RHOB|nr:transporter substrate-binding domain-containing protein [Rubellimicrobium roseum]TNC68526.1 transporter substrate-binding domain-containing protein [Rubellimicrobium roseum]